MTPRAALAFALHAFATVAFVAAAWGRWGWPAGVTVAGMCAFAAGCVLLFAETSPVEGSTDKGDTGP
jgi:hypothetical protein